jgi:hypothetical protein
MTGGISLNFKEVEEALLEYIDAKGVRSELFFLSRLTLLETPVPVTKHSHHMLSDTAVLKLRSGS